MINEVDDSVKFAWAYLLSYGKITNGKWNIYGGAWEDENGGISWDSHKQDVKNLADKAVLIGIDWRRTTVPCVHQESVFQDSFSPSTDRLATIGTLFLLSGEKFLVGSSREEAAHLAKTAKQMMTGRESPVTALAAKL
jgi:hypothetical protein